MNVNGHADSLTVVTMAAPAATMKVMNHFVRRVYSFAFLRSATRAMLLSKPRLSGFGTLGEGSVSWIVDDVLQGSLVFSFRKVEVLLNEGEATAELALDTVFFGRVVGFADRS